MAGQADSHGCPNETFREIDSLTAYRPSPYDPAPMAGHHEQGKANPIVIAIPIGLVIAAVWVWKRLSAETQDYVIDQAVPLAAGGLVIVLLLLLAVRRLRRRIQQRRERDRLITAFQQEPAQDKKLDLSFALAECNGYRVDGLEAVAPALKDLWITTLRQAVGDKQHRFRGMAASHLGILQDQSVVPLLVKALDDDHAYVRSCAILGLGRLRATETRERLATMMKDDWDQTVRSRAKEALERMR
jgi:HEAT repeats